jgi:hypothetical protein
LAIAILAIGASISGLLNQYAQDDIAIVLKNPRLHDLGGIARVFSEPYWPPPFIPALYRPFSSISLALQWALGGGSPVALRVVSYLLYAVTCLALFRLTRLSLPLAAAFVAGALFAVHPVHVESVALGVNQSEVWVGLLSCVAVSLYVRARSRGPVDTRTVLLLAALYLTACLFKENALVMPGLLVAAEFLLVPNAEAPKARVAQLRLPVLVLMLVAVTFYWVRTRVLSGSLLGTFVAEAFAGLSVGERALTMLAVVPHWFRLLLWPAELQADYAPAELIAHTSWGSAQILGLVLLLGALVAALAAWRRAPVVTFGIAWAAMGLFPVHNVLVPTGILLAERTLFLPSIGVAIALGGVAALLLEGATPRRKNVLAVGLAALLILGLYRSNSRHTTWSDQFTLWYKTANEDAPTSWWAHETLAETYFLAGVERMAEQEYQISMQFAPPRVTRPHTGYADKLRLRGHCYPAAALYRRVLEVRPENSATRAGLIACLLDLGAYREAMYHARMGISFDWHRPVFQRALATAESAQRVSAAPGSVRMIVAPGDTVGALLTIGEKK